MGGWGLTTTCGRRAITRSGGTALRGAGEGGGRSRHGGADPPDGPLAVRVVATSPQGGHMGAVCFLLLLLVVVAERLGSCTLAIAEVLAVEVLLLPGQTRGSSGGPVALEGTATVGGSSRGLV